MCSSVFIYFHLFSALFEAKQKPKMAREALCRPRLHTRRSLSNSSRGRRSLAAEAPNGYHIEIAPKINANVIETLFESLFLSLFFMNFHVFFMICHLFVRNRLSFGRGAHVAVLEDGLRGRREAWRRRRGAWPRGLPSCQAG